MLPTSIRMPGGRLVSLNLPDNTIAYRVEGDPQKAKISVRLLGKDDPEPFDVFRNLQKENATWKCPTGDPQALPVTLRSPEKAKTEIELNFTYDRQQATWVLRDYNASVDLFRHLLALTDPSERFVA